MMLQKKILVVDDVGYNRLIVSRFLRDAGYEVFEASGGDEGLKLLSKERFQLVITDLMMPETDGMAFFRRAKTSTFIDDSGEMPCPPFVLCTVENSSDVLENAIREGFRDVIIKPVTKNRILDAVERGLKEADEILRIQVSGQAGRYLLHLAENIQSTPSEVIQFLITELSQAIDESDVKSFDGFEALIRRFLKNL